MISDTYKREEAVYWIGLLNAIVTAVMALAPILGGYLNVFFGWRACYTFVSLITIIQMILLLLYLPETKSGQPISIKNALKDYKMLCGSLRFLQSSLGPTLLCAGYMAFVSVIPFLYQ